MHSAAWYMYVSGHSLPLLCIPCSSDLITFAIKCQFIAIIYTCCLSWPRCINCKMSVYTKKLISMLMLYHHRKIYFTLCNFACMQLFNWSLKHQDTMFIFVQYFFIKINTHNCFKFYFCFIRTLKS